MIRQAGDAALPERQRRLNRALKAAALARNTAEILRLKAAGGQLEAPGPTGFPPLAECAAFGTAGQCAALLDAGARPDGEGAHSAARAAGPAFSAVRFARSNPDAAAILRLLHERGADFNAPADRAEGPFTGETPLHAAARLGAAACADALLDSGASPQARNALGEQPAETAKAHGHHALAEQLEARLREAHMEHDPSMDFPDEPSAAPEEEEASAPDFGM